MPALLCSCAGTRPLFFVRDADLHCLRLRALAQPSIARDRIKPGGSSGLTQGRTACAADQGRAVMARCAPLSHLARNRPTPQAQPDMVMCCSGMIVFKLERERPAYATHGGILYYIKDRCRQDHSPLVHMSTAPWQSCMRCSAVRCKLAAAEDSVWVLGSGFRGCSSVSRPRLDKARDHCVGVCATAQAAC